LAGVAANIRYQAAIGVRELLFMLHSQVSTSFIARGGQAAGMGGDINIAKQR